ncbi:Probable methyltransferase TCM_000336 [Linum perenne]
MFFEFQVPPGLYDEHGKSINKGNIYIAESSPSVVSHAYVNQFQADFTMFLRSRAVELVTGGRMVMILTGRIGHDHVDRGNSLLWKLLSSSLAILASQVHFLVDRGKFFMFFLFNVNDFFIRLFFTGTD